ncbi:MAG TPA: apolipoprotein N-acyltransferase [Sulfurospirillum sp. UBA12182]|nr:MAG TPA: apolipoprotein N-acyltransferase [Sulfurospirillum sp. UBA12182]
MEAMKQINFHHLAYESFDKKFSKRYFSTSIIIKAFFIAFCLSVFIYLEYFSFSYKFLDSLFAFIGFYYLLKSSKQEMFWIGFFIGIFWFYWIGFSFRYYELSYLIPLVILGVGLIYAVVFLFFALLTPTLFLRSLGIIFFSYVAPFGFNWFKFELTLINSYFSTHIYIFATFILLIYLFHKFKGDYKLISLLGIFSLAFVPLHVKPNLAPIDVKIPQTFLEQNKKWEKTYKEEIINTNLSLIKEAISERKELIILPESAFPTYLNLEKTLLLDLEYLSNYITIYTGALSIEDRKVLNSAYVFENGKTQIAHKVILVPFGEQIPLPKFARDFINDLFFNGAEDYESAKEPHNFIIKGLEFRNAICFEATKDALFEGNPRYMVAISNNAWFTPSIEPTLQNLLLRYYARKYKTTIYHSANGGISEVIF